MDLPWASLGVRMPAKPLLSKAEVCLYLEVGEDALEGLIRAGRFHRPIRVSPNTLRWKAEWVGLYLAWVAESAHLEPDPAGPPAGIEADRGGSAGIDPDSPGSGGKRRDRGGAG
jgi:hypothetical protein